MHETMFLPPASLAPRIAPTEASRGIECCDLINSPNLSPAAYNNKQMQRELSCPSQSRLVLDWLRARQVQVVHIHSLEGYPLSLIREIRDTVQHELGHYFGLEEDELPF